MSRSIKVIFGLLFNLVSILFIIGAGIGSAKYLLQLSLNPIISVLIIVVGIIVLFLACLALVLTSMSIATEM